MSDNESRKVARSPRDRVLRYIGLLIGVIVGWQLGARLASERSGTDWGLPALGMAALLGGLCFIIAPYVTVGFSHWLRRKLSAIPAIDIVAAGIGLVVGGVLSSLLALPTSLLPNPWGEVLPFVVAVAACTLSVFAVVLRKDELTDLLLRRDGITNVEDKLLLDTSVIIDGRIVDVMRTGLVTMPLVVPRFVLRELQSIADAGELQRKARGRRGLDVLDQLQRDERVEIDILEVDVDEEAEVDNKLIRLAELSRYHILTGDQNLERVARLRGVGAINLNTVAQALRPPVIAGEELAIDIVQAGREAGQGIGFLDDGTLIVVEDGRERIGRSVRVVVTRTLQTATGRMAFATLKEEVVA